MYRYFLYYFKFGNNLKHTIHCVYIHMYLCERRLFLQRLYIYLFIYLFLYLNFFFSNSYTIFNRLHIYIHVHSIIFFKEIICRVSYTIGHCRIWGTKAIDSFPNLLFPLNIIKSATNILIHLTLFYLCR